LWIGLFWPAPTSPIRARPFLAAGWSFHPCSGGGRTGAEAGGSNAGITSGAALLRPPRRPVARRSRRPPRLRRRPHQRAPTRRRRLPPQVSLAPRTPLRRSLALISVCGKYV
jgi:hypothetical protein